MIIKFQCYRKVRRCIFLVLFLATLLKADPQNNSLQGISTDQNQLIQRFAATETTAARAWYTYAYRESISLEEIDAMGALNGGKWEQVDEINFSEGRRAKSLLKPPLLNLQHIQLTQDDQDRFDMHFFLTQPEISAYEIKYLGREQVRGIDCVSFYVMPARLVPNKVYFQGQIWVDGRDHIVKTYGKTVGSRQEMIDNQFPKMATYRVFVDGYWLPGYTHGDDLLHFANGQEQRILLSVVYQYASKSTNGQTADNARSTLGSCDPRYAGYVAGKWAGKVGGALYIPQGFSVHLDLRQDCTYAYRLGDGDLDWLALQGTFTIRPNPDFRPNPYGGTDIPGTFPFIITLTPDPRSLVHKKGDMNLFTSGGILADQERTCSVWKGDFRGLTIIFTAFPDRTSNNMQMMMLRPE
jgi:hypothetical protein